MATDRLFAILSELTIFTDQAESLLKDEDRKAIQDAEELFQNMREERGLMSFNEEELGDIWEEAIDAVQGAREAVFRRHDLAEALMYRSRINRVMLQ